MICHILAFVLSPAPALSDRGEQFCWTINLFRLNPSDTCGLGGAPTASQSSLHGHSGKGMRDSRIRFWLGSGCCGPP